MEWVVGKSDGSSRWALLLIALSGSLGWVVPASATPRRPNVIILTPDQMRGQAMGVAGNVQVRTPHLDRLARDGLYLPTTFANNPVCCPARATPLTWSYPHEHGLILNDLRLRESQTTLAELLAGAGYATGFVGKWHLDGGTRQPGFVPPGPRRQGFQFWAANQCDHRHFNAHYFHDTDTPIEIDRFEPQVWMDEAIKFIRANKDQPFFLWWTCGPPHNPYQAPPAYEKLYDPDRLTLRPNWKQTRGGSRKNIASYYAMITAIDDQIGRLQEELEASGLAEDTIVLFVSDHGDMLGSHGLRLKTKPWEESIRVPGIIRYPRRIKPGQQRDLLFSLVDIAPTVLSLCGVTPPGAMQGHDLSKQLLGETSDEPEAVFFQIYMLRPHTGVPEAWRGVRTKRYKYVRFADKAWALYDLQQDPYELTNLSDKPEYAVLQARLDAMLQREMVRTGDNWDRNLRPHQVFYKGPAIYHPDDLKTQPAG